MQAFLRNSDSAIKFCIILHDLTGFLLTRECDALQQSRGNSQTMEQYLLAYMTTQQGIRRLLPLWLNLFLCCKLLCWDIAMWGSKADCLRSLTQQHLLPCFVRI